jgi:hypothetical protein
MAKVGGGSFLAVMLGASVMALAGCNGGGGASAGGNTTAGNAAVLAPANAPTQVAAAPTPVAGPTRYCGTIHNTSVGQDEPGEIDVNPGAGFSGTIILNGSTLQGGAGPFQGTNSGGQCGAMSTSGGLSFTGACPTGTEYDGTYTIQGQQGTFQMSSTACH